MIKEIITYPDKRLKQKSKDVEVFDKDLHKLLDDMYDTMIEIWISANKLKINAAKTKSMCFHTKQKEIEYPKLLFGNTEVENVKCFNFLGIIIDEHLSWSDHINCLSTKLSRAIGVINRMKNCLPCYILKTLYYSMFACHLNYGILLWGLCQ